MHDPDNPARRIGCADLVPGTADLTYSWSFGDGTTGSGADPDHTYATPGTYTATVTVAHGSGAHAGHLSVSDSVQVVVGAWHAAGGDARPCWSRRTDAVAGAGGSRGSRPTRTVADRTPTIRGAWCATATPACATGRSCCASTGAAVTGVTYVAARDLVRWTPRKQLAPGRHVVRLVARDALGNRTVRSWRFTVRR